MKPSLLIGRYAAPALAAILAVTVLVAIPRGAQSQSQAVARIGTEAITRDALFAHLRTYYGKRGVDELVRLSQVRQEVARARVTVTDAAVEARAAEVKKGLGARITLADALAQEGITEATWKDRLRYEVMVEKLGDAKWPIKEDDLVRLTVRYCRTQSDQQARTVIEDARNGVNFENLVRINSMDKEEGGLIQPERFFRIDNPRFFKLATDANLRVGQVTPKPLKEGQFSLVLKLEGRLGSETLAPKERADAIKRIRAFRMTGMSASLARRFKLEYPTAAATLAASPPPAAEAVVAKVTPTTPGAPTKPESIVLADLDRHLLTNYGKAALDQLIERTWIAQDAKKAGVSVSDADVDGRVAEVTRGGTSKDLDTALATEGITLAAWKSRVRYTMLAERIVGKRVPAQPEDLERITVSFILVATQAAATQVVRDMEGGATFDKVRMARGINRRGDGFVQPKAFLRIDNPDVFGAVEKAEPGQIVGDPLSVPGGFAVLRLDARFGSETMTGKERDSALRRLNVSRMQPELDRYRRAYKIEYGVPLSTLLTDLK